MAEERSVCTDETAEHHGAWALDGVGGGDRGGSEKTGGNGSGDGGGWISLQQSVQSQPSAADWPQSKELLISRQVDKPHGLEQLDGRDGGLGGDGRGGGGGE